MSSVVGAQLEVSVTFLITTAITAVGFLIAARISPFCNPDIVAKEQ